VVVKSSPASAFVMAKAKFLLKILKVALDTPAQFGDLDEIGRWHVGGQGQEPVFGRFGFILGPFDHEPFFRSGLGAQGVAVGGATITASKA